MIQAEGEVRGGGGRGGKACCSAAPSWRSLPCAWRRALLRRARGARRRHHGATCAAMSSSRMEQMMLSRSCCSDSKAGARVLALELLQGNAVRQSCRVRILETGASQTLAFDLSLRQGTIEFRCVGVGFFHTVRQCSFFVMVE